jgi:hypothetical protein
VKHHYNYLFKEVLYFKIQKKIKKNKRIGGQEMPSTNRTKLRDSHA